MHCLYLYDIIVTYHTIGMEFTTGASCLATVGLNSMSGDEMDSGAFDV